MSLIKCPECQNEISDKSQKCIYCGYPINPKTKIAIPTWVSIIVAGLWIILTIINERYDEVMNNSLFAAFPIIILLFLKSSNQFTSKIENKISKEKQRILFNTIFWVLYLIAFIFIVFRENIDYSNSNSYSFFTPYELDRGTYLLLNEVIASIVVIICIITSFLNISNHLIPSMLMLASGIICFIYPIKDQIDTAKQWSEFDSPLFYKKAIIESFAVLLFFLVGSAYLLSLKWVQSKQPHQDEKDKQENSFET